MLLMFQKGIREGITQGVQSYEETSNNCLKERYNPDEKSTYFPYLGSKNL